MKGEDIYEYDGKYRKPSKLDFHIQHVTLFLESSTISVCLRMYAHDQFRSVGSLMVRHKNLPGIRTKCKTYLKTF